MLLPSAPFLHTPLFQLENTVLIPEQLYRVLCMCLVVLVLPAVPVGDKPESLCITTCAECRDAILERDGFMGFGSITGKV